MSFTYNLNPVFFTLGPVQVRYYGLVYALAFLAAYLWLIREGKKGRLPLAADDVDILLLYLIPCVIVLARVFEIVFYEPGYYLSNPSEMVALWHGGMSFHGGLVGAAVGIMLYLRHHNKKHPAPFERLTPYQLLDALVPIAALALFFGRIANFVNGELWGTVTNVPWCVYFPGVEGCRHPSQLYEALKNLIIFFVLIIVARKDAKIKPAEHHKRLPSGFLFWLFVLLYGTLRFLVNFFRDDPRWLGISTGQYLSLAMAVLAAVMLWRLHRDADKKRTMRLREAIR